MRGVNSVRFSPDGERIALGLQGGYVHIINLKGERLQDRKFELFCLFFCVFHTHI